MKDIEKQKKYKSKLYYIDGYAILMEIKNNNKIVLSLIDDTSAAICKGESEVFVEDKDALAFGIILAAKRLMDNYYKNYKTSTYIYNSEKDCYYKIGKETSFKDSYDCRLHIGDLINFYNREEKFGIIINRNGLVLTNLNTFVYLDEIDAITKYVKCFSNIDKGVLSSLFNKTSFCIRKGEK